MVTHSPYLLDSLELDRHKLALCCADCGIKIVGWSAGQQRSRDELLGFLKHHKPACEGWR